MGPGRTTPMGEKKECLNCGRAMDMVSHLNEEVSPEPGDLTFCLYCCEPMQFDDDMNFKMVSSDDLKEMRRDNPESAKQIDEVREFLLQRKSKYN